MYKNPEIFIGDKHKARDVTSPATTTSTRAQLFFTPDSEKQPQRSHSTGRANTYRNRVKWLNTPVKATEYKKDEEGILEDVEEPVIIKDQKPEKEDKDELIKVQGIFCEPDFSSVSFETIRWKKHDMHNWTEIL